MSRPNIVILGGGIAGLLAAFAFRHLKPTIVERSDMLGGNFTAGGLKYIHHTAATAALLRFLGFEIEPYNPRGVLHWGDLFLDYPSGFIELDPSDRRTIQVAHWVKTRGTIKGFRDDCMNDPMGEHGALRIDHGELISKLAKEVIASGCPIWLSSEVSAIEHQPGNVHLRLLKAPPGVGEQVIPYDVLIPTLPIGNLSALAIWADLPSIEPSRLWVCPFEIPHDKWRLDWDYMYTPQAQWVSRISRVGCNISVEMPAQDWKESRAVERMAHDLQIIFNQPVGSCGAPRAIPGHIRPLATERAIKWPDHWYPLGRFAEWDPRATADKVYARALVLAAQIGHEHRRIME